MNKKKVVLRLLLVVSAVVLLCLLGIGGKIYSEFIGTPWERAATKKQLEAYVQKRFAQKMDTTDEGGISMTGTVNGYIYCVRPEGKKNCITVHQEGRGSPDFWDDYYAAAWKAETEAKIQAFLQTIYTVETHPRVEIEYSDFSQFPQWGISQAPSLMDMRENVSAYDLTIFISPTFDRDHPDREYETMNRLIQFLKESDLVPRYLDYIFGFTSSGPEKGKYIRYDFSKDDLTAITSVQTMIAILEKHENGNPNYEVFH